MAPSPKGTQTWTHRVSGGVPEAPHEGVQLSLAGELCELRGEALAHEDRDPGMALCPPWESLVSCKKNDVTPPPRCNLCRMQA